MPSAFKQCDVAIVGGGPAGIATALFLSHADAALTDRIVVLEKETYPRDKFCGGAIGMRADHLLATIGVRVDVPSVHVNGFSFISQSGLVEERLPEPIGRVIRRLEFDHALARSAATRGIDIVEDARVTAMEVDTEGVTLATPRGNVRARAVVGADGVGGIVRRHLGLGSGNLRAQVIELDTEPVASDPERDLLHFDISDRDFTGYVWDFPTLVDNRELVCRGVYHLKYASGSEDIQARLQRHLDARGLNISDYRLKRFAERAFIPHTPHAAPRVLLVGEAAGIDGVTGEGIAQAIQYGAFAGEYLAEKLVKDALDFEDWNKRLARTKVGIDLRIRHSFLPYYYGKHRGWFEPYFSVRPEFVASSLGEFAGRRISNLRVAKGAVAGIWNWMTGNGGKPKGPTSTAG